MSFIELNSGRRIIGEWGEVETLDLVDLVTSSLRFGFLGVNFILLI